MSPTNLRLPPDFSRFSSAPFLPVYHFSSEDELSSQVAKVPPPLQLHWEAQGISGRAYQKDGDPSLYRKKVYPRRTVAFCCFRVARCCLRLFSVSRGSQACWRWFSRLLKVAGLVALDRLGVVEGTYPSVGSLL